MSEMSPEDEPIARERDDAPDDEAETAEEGANGAQEVPYDVIAKRAYEIWESGEGGTAQENWERAATELGADPKR